MIKIFQGFLFVFNTESQSVPDLHFVISDSQTPQSYTTVYSNAEMAFVVS